MMTHSTGEIVQAFAMPAVLLIGILLVAWDRRRARRGKQPVVRAVREWRDATGQELAEDGPPDEPYRVYTRAHDLEVLGRLLPERLATVNPDRVQGWTDRNGTLWRQRIAELEQMRAAAKSDPSAFDRLREVVAAAGSDPSLDGVAILFLIDQSGSMKGAPMIAVADAMHRLTEPLALPNVQTEILGFSTVGWRGGLARQDWLREGQQARPGRLCALLHIVYKSSEEPCWEETSQKAMLHPDILRENLDGEALEWAMARLRKMPAGRKLLVIISDGAPVDDATLAANGPSFLERHLLTVIAEAKGDIRLGAVGVGFAVDRYYACSRKAEIETVAEAVAELIIEMCGG